MPRPRVRSASLPLLLGVLVTILLTTLCLLQRVGVWLPGGGVIELAERATLDRRFRARGPVETGDAVVLVMIDDRTLAEDPLLGERREGTRRLVDAIARQRPRVIGLDLLFAAPERLLSDALSGRVDAYLSTQPDHTRDEATRLLAAVQAENSGDAALERALKDAAQVVLALHLGARGEELPDDPALKKARYGQIVLGPRRPDRVERAL
ncbi:MAG: CHASE2 domain-containing protein, partial [Myxococcales bacterium]|nr:CHASE2 domain-containing protein [Myxococcales bacterium]